ncbi:hypothetical protein D3C86_1327510 [compost metagenome]
MYRRFRSRAEDLQLFIAKRGKCRRYRCQSPDQVVDSGNRLIPVNAASIFKYFRSMRLFIYQVLWLLCNVFFQQPVNCFDQQLRTGLH